MMISSNILIVFATVLRIASGRRNIVLSLDDPLRAGDEIVIEGHGHAGSKGVIRLYDTESSCYGRKGAVNPLILKLLSRIRLIEILMKNELTNCIERAHVRRSLPHIGAGRRYKITIEVQRDGYHIKSREHGRSRLLYGTTGGVGSVGMIRAYSGNYSDISVKRFVPLPAAECGLRSVPEVRTRIAGGTDALPGQFPWQAAIRKYQLFDWDPVPHLCGGTLIRDCWILTAAHCTKQLRHLTDYYVRLGDYDNDDASTTTYDEDQQDFPIDKVFVHEDYTSGNHPPNDISLIKLKKVNGVCATRSENVKPACLPDPGSDNFTASARCEISGWGAKRYGDAATRYPNILQKGKVQLKSGRECRDIYGQNRHGRYLVQDGMVCAAGDADTCQGDSGGPLVCQRDRTDPHSPFVIWGLTSWGDGCGRKLKPGVYTRVLSYVPWIDSIISSNGD